MSRSVMSNQRRFAIEYAKAYVMFHNAASYEFKKAFKKVGARMWHFDNAHILTDENMKHISNAIFTGKSGMIDVYHIVHPLTVLDSYPEVKWDKVKRANLDAEVNAIKAKYDDLWNTTKSELIKKYNIFLGI